MYISTTKIMSDAVSTEVAKLSWRYLGYGLEDRVLGFDSQRGLMQCS